jgi:hypothetical protein
MAHPSGRKLDLTTGLVSLTEGQEDFLEWLCGARPEGESQAAYAQRAGVTSETCRRWKKDPSFLQMWQERMVSTHAHPDTLSRQLENLNRMAQGSGPDAIRATQLYWTLVDKMTPTRVEHSGPGATAGMSDGELAQRLAEAAAAAADRAEPESPKAQADRVRADLGLRVV